MLGEGVQDGEVGVGVGRPQQGFAQQSGGPPDPVGFGCAGPGLGEGVEAVDQALELAAQALRGQSAQGLQDGPDPVPGYGEAGPGGPVDEGGQGGRDVQVEGLDPVGQLLVGEAEAGPGGHQQSLGEHGGGPAGAPREQLLEVGPGERPLPGSQAAPGGLVDPAGHARREPPHPGAVHPGAPGLVGGDADRGAQAQQVQVGGEDLVAAGAADRDLGGADPGQQAQGERVPGVGLPDGALGDAEAGPGGLGLGGGEVAEREGGRHPAGGAGRGVEHLGRAEGAARSQCSGRAATASRAPAARSQPTVASVQGPRRWASSGGISSGASSTTSSARPASPATRATCSASASAAGRSPGSAGPPAVTIRAAAASARVTASASEVSPAVRSAPRSHSVGAGRDPRARRTARAASAVVRPVPGSPTRPRTRPSPAVKASSSAAVPGRSTGSKPGSASSGGKAAPTVVPVSSRIPARFRSGPYAGTVAVLRSSSAASGPAGSATAAARRATAKPPERCSARRAVPRTASTAPVSASRTGPPQASPPRLSASRPSVPIASSIAARAGTACSPPAVG